MKDRYPGSDAIIETLENTMTIKLSKDAPLADILSVLWQLDIVPMVSKTCVDEIILTFKDLKEESE